MPLYFRAKCLIEYTYQGFCINLYALQCRRNRLNSRTYYSESFRSSIQQTVSVVSAFHFSTSLAKVVATRRGKTMLASAVTLTGLAVKRICARDGNVKGRL